MALVESQEVKLAISTETLGAEQVTSLAQDIDALTQGGEEAARAFAPLVEEIDQLGKQVVSVQGLDDAIAGAKQARAAFVEARDQVEILDKALADARGAGANRQAIRLLEADLKKANTTLSAQERAWNKQRSALNAARAATAAAGVDTRKLAAEKQRLAAATDNLRSRVAGLQSATAPATRGLGEMRTEAREAGGELKNLSTSGDELGTKFRALAGAVAGVFAVSKIKSYAGDMIGVADAYGQMAIRIEQATSSQEEYDRVQQRLLDNANTTYRPLAEAQEMYIRTSGALRAMGYETEQALDITDSFSFLLTSNAASAERASSALNAYTKSIQSQKVSVESWQSILAAMPTVVDALSTATGKSTEEILRLGSSGKLAIEDLNEGLRQTVELNEAAVEAMPTTVADAVTRLANVWSVYIGEANRAGGATQQLVDLINAVSENLDQLVTYAVRAGEVMLAVFAVKAVRAVRAYAAAQLVAASAAGTLTAAQTAQAAATAANTRALGAQVIATGLLARAGSAAVAPLVALTTTTTAATAAIWHKVRALGALRAAMMATGVGALVVGIGALVGKLTESKVSADDLKDGIDEAFSEPSDKVTPALQTVITTGEAARFKLSEVQKQFLAIAQDAATVEGELRKVFAAAKLGDTDGIAQLVADMDELQKSALATGDQIDAALGQRLAQLTSKELREFGIMAEMAFGQGRISAEQLARINNEVLSASFEKLGINAAQALGQISAPAQDAINGIDTLNAALLRVNANAATTGQALADGIGSAINTADSTAALDALSRKVKDLGEQGRISGQQVAAALDLIRNKSDDLTPGINSAAEALRQLRITSDAELKKVASSAQEAYRAIVEMGGSVREQREAFRVYAEAAVAANNGVVDSTLQVQAAQHGLQVTADATGRVVVASMRDASGAVREVATEGDRASRSLKAVADSARQAAEATRAAAVDTKNAAQSLVDSAAIHNRSVSGFTIPWLEGAAAASQYAEEAGRVAQQEAKSAAAASRSARGVADSIRVGQAAARWFVATMEDLDRQQARLNQSSAGGVEDLRMRLLELEGTEEQVAEARAARDRQERRRQIASLQIEIQRARIRGDQETVKTLSQEITLLNEQIKLLNKIENVEKQRRQEARWQVEREQAEAEAAVAAPASAPAPTITRRVEINLNGRTHTINTDAAGERSLDALLDELERAAGVAQ